MVKILREADASPVVEVARKHKLSEQTIYTWRKHFGTLQPQDVKRLKQLDQDCTRLKRLLAERDLDVLRARGFYAAALVFSASPVLRTLDQSLCAGWPYGTHWAWHLLNALTLSLCVLAISHSPGLSRNRM